MIIRGQAKNGQIVNAIKSYNELTDNEQAHLMLPYGDSKDDYINYQVRYNRKGTLLGVSGHELKETDEDAGVDMVDSMQLLFGNKRSKAYQSAKKRAGVASKQVNDARLVIKKRGKNVKN